MGYFVDLSDFRAPSYGSVSGFRGESPVEPIGLCSDLLRSKPKVRNRTVARGAKVRKFHQIPFRSQVCIDSESELGNVLPLHNHKLQAAAAKSDFAM